MSGQDAFAPRHISALKAIEAKLGRPLRVLHVGNIANNAYNNARIQRQYGIEADVLSYDEYHIMATPEWEDAEFEGEVDANSPNWWGTTLGGWKRPEWFVQGPAAVCLQYLRAKHLGLGRLQELLWRYLEARCLGQVRSTCALRGEPLPPVPVKLRGATFAAKLLGVSEGPPLRVSQDVIDDLLSLQTKGGENLFDLGHPEADPSVVALLRYRANATPALAQMENTSASPTSVGDRWAEPRAYAQTLYRLFLDSLVFKPLRANKRSLFTSLWLKQRQMRGFAHDSSYAAQLDLGDDGLTQLKNLARTRWWRIRDFKSSLCRLAANMLSLLYFSYRREAKLLAQYSTAISPLRRDAHFKRQLAAIADDLEKISPKERLLFLHYGMYCSQFMDILDNYDIIQGYSIDGCLCAFNGLKHFISYEHGTLRDLPFGNDFFGVATRLAYHSSTYAFVTNSDVLPSVDRMGLSKDRVVCLPHAFDDTKLINFRMQNSDLLPSAGPPIIFSPTRQHWKDKSGSWTKGNDILLRAAALVAAEGFDFRLHLVAWGKELDDSRALISQLGIANKIVWLATMQKRELWRAYCTAHAVADQFTLPALGGVGFEAMALGRRLLTAIDANQLKNFFGAAPPCMAASSVTECAEHLRRVISDPEDRSGLGLAAQRWIRTYHSAQRIVDIQAKTYEQFLNKARPATKAAT